MSTLTGRTLLVLLNDGEVGAALLRAGPGCAGFLLFRAVLFAGRRGRLLLRILLLRMARSRHAAADPKERRHRPRIAEGGAEILTILDQPIQIGEHRIAAPQLAQCKPLQVFRYAGLEEGCEI